MAGVGPGTAIAGRYALRRIVHRAPRGQRWAAHDTSTGYDVAVLLVPSASPNADAVLDAAKRAAVLEDPRLVGVVDAGQDAGYTFVVEEVDEALTLRALLDDGPLAPEEARRIVGETAVALERARQRGLHHQELTPEHVAVRRDGVVRVRGLAVDAALAGSDATDGRIATKKDTTSLAGLLYAALTATWPLSGSSLTASPRVGRTVVTPSELAGGIPAVLDDVAVKGLRGAYEIPGDLAERIAPWSDRAVGRVVEAGPDADTQPVGSEKPLPPQTLPDELRDDIAHPQNKTLAAAGAAVTAAAVGGRAAAEKARVAARAAAARAAERRRESIERREAEKASETSLSAIAEDAPAEAEPVAPILARDVPTHTPSPRQARFVLGCMGAFVTVALVLACLGLLHAVNVVQDKVAAGAGPTPTRTVTAPAVTVTAKPGGGVVSAAPSPSATGAEIPIVGVAAFDPPPGDGNENADRAPMVRDGDPTSYWQSSRYSTAGFGGLKPGVGVTVDLGQKSSVRAVTLTVPEQGAGEEISVYLADDSPTTVDGLTKLGSTTAVSGTNTITATTDPGQHQYVVVWFTKAAQVPGGFRTFLSEIKLSS